MSPETVQCIQNMRIFTGRILPLLGTYLEQDYEVGMDSLVQVVQLLPGSKVAWKFYQYEVAKAEPSFRDPVMGMYLNEAIGNYKVVGIYKVLRPLA